MATYVLGDNSVLSIWDGSAYLPIGCLTSNELSLTRNIIETQTKCSGGLVEIQSGSLAPIEISFEANYIEDDATKYNFLDLFSSINVAVGVDVEWKITTGQTTPSALYGTGILTSLSLSAPTGDEFATYSGSIMNKGVIVTVDPNA